jgi:hypothetical protein
MTTPLGVIHATNYLLMYAQHHDVLLNRTFDLNEVVPEGCTLDAKVDFIRIFRRLKVMCGLAPWPAAREETGFIDVKINEEHIRYEVCFFTVHGEEKAQIARSNNEPAQKDNA